MAVITTTRFTEGYDPSATDYDGGNERLDVSEFLDTLDPWETPLLALVGRDSLETPCTQIKHEWLEDAVIGLSTTSTDTDLNNTSTGVVTLTVASGEGLKFRGYGTSAYDGTGPCDVLRISSTAGEELAICLGSASTSVIVERGYGSWSTPVDHTGYTKTIQIVGTMQPQGLKTPGSSRITLKSTLYNYTQIFEDTYETTATHDATAKIVRGDENARQRARIAKKLGVLMDAALLFGKKQAPTTTTVGSTMDGIRTRISTNVYNKAGVKLQDVHLEDAMEASWRAGGKRDLYALMNSTQRRVVNRMLDPWRQTGYSDSTFGTRVDRFETPFGAITVVLHREMPQDEVLMIEKARVGFGPLRPLREGKLPSTTLEYDQWQWTGEYTAEVRQESVHARIYGLSTTNVL